MLQARSNRWLIIVFFIFISTLSSLSTVGVANGEPQFIRYTVLNPHMPLQGSDVQGIASSSSVVITQVKELDIGVNNFTKNKPAPTITETKNEEWGTAKQIDEYTWTVKISQDNTMATPHEAFVALNNYRQKNNRGTLSWDGALASYAQSRANVFHAANTLDSHAGFKDYLDNQNGFKKLGFSSLGENSSLGYTVTGIRLIGSVYAADKPHNDNQLDTKWSSVGVGIVGTATNFIFGGARL